MSNQEIQNTSTQIDLVRAKRRRIIFIIILLILIIVAIYVYTYYFAKRDKRVIFQDPVRRIYLIERKGYAGRPDRERWVLVYEDQKTGKRQYVLANTKKGYNEKKLVKIILNTIDKGQTKSFDQVERVGVTMRPANTDIHSNLIEKKGIESLDFEFPDFEKELKAA